MWGSNWDHFCDKVDRKETDMPLQSLSHLLPEYRAFHRPSRGHSLRLERPWVLELEGHLPRKMPALDGNLSKKQIFTVLNSRHFRENRDNI